MKRQYTRTVYWAQYGGGTHIKVGYIYNKTTGVKEDVIAVRMLAVEGLHEYNLRLDEAVALAAGLTKVATQMLVGQLPIPDLADE